MADKMCRFSTRRQGEAASNPKKPENLSHPDIDRFWQVLCPTSGILPRGPAEHTRLVTCPLRQNSGPFGSLEPRPSPPRGQPESRKTRR